MEGGVGNLFFALPPCCVLYLKKPNIFSQGVVLSCPVLILFMVL